MLTFPSHSMYEAQIKRIYLTAIKEMTLARLCGRWNGKDLWEGWDITRVEEIIKENKW